MNTINTTTEERIKEVARRVFFTEGKLNATTQEIADAAGVNRTLINYYFRSRDALFEIVFNESMSQFGQNIESIILQEIPIKDRIESLVEFLLKEMKNNPYREIFFITQINQKNNQDFKIKDGPESNNWKIFLDELQAEMDSGQIQSMNPINYILNIYSMCIFPILIKPVFTKMFRINPEEYQTLLDNRKTNIMNSISRTIK
jgi:AcrR family transcriptional regulator